jgi:hypothetical protein
VPFGLSSITTTQHYLCSTTLEIIHDFIVFDSGTKKTCRHNQYFGTKAAQQHVQRREGGNRRSEKLKFMARPVNRKCLECAFDQMKAEPTLNQMIRQLAEEEDPVKWSATIARWLQENAPEDFVCLQDLFVAKMRIAALLFHCYLNHHPLCYGRYFLRRLSQVNGYRI